MATAGRADHYFPVTEDDAPGVTLLPSSERRSSAEFRHSPRSGDRLRQRSRTNSLDDLLDSTKKPRKLMSVGVFSLIILIIAVMFLLGVCLGFYVRELQLDKPDYDKLCKGSEDEDEKVKKIDRLGGIYESLVYYIRSKGITDFTEEFGIHDARTGDDQDRKMADSVLQDFRDHVEDTIEAGAVTEEEYDVTMTSCDPARPNEVEILSSNRSRVQHFVLSNNLSHTDQPTEPVHSEEDLYYQRNESDGWEFPHVAFSPPGVAEGRLVYAHYGRPTDFLILRSLKVQLRGSIVLVRLGRLPVSEQIRNCESEGASAVLLFWDDSDIAFDLGSDVNSSSFIPYMTAADRSIDNISPWRPSIPCQTISADQAQTLLTTGYGSVTSGLVMTPTQWRDLNQTPFAVGVRRKNSPELPIVRVSVYNVAKQRKVRNIVATIQGLEHPDRYIIVGAPRASLPGQPQDAVVSTSILVQLARAFSYIYRLHQWLPRRGVKLVSWGGAELADSGMLAFIKKQPHQLNGRMLMYFDLAHLVDGLDNIQASIPEMMEQLLNEVTFDVPDPVDADKMLNSAWNTRMTSTSFISEDPTHNPFLQMLGIPVVQAKYTVTPGSKPEMSATLGQEMHHHFKFHLAIVRLLTSALLNILDQQLLPFDLQAAAHGMHSTIWHTSHVLDDCSDGLYKLDTANSMCEQLSTSATSFKRLTSHFMSLEESRMIASLNDIIMEFDRMFVVGNNHGHRYNLLHPTLSDGSLDVAAELCQAGKILSDWNETKSFESFINRAISEALLNIKLGS